DLLHIDWTTTASNLETFSIIITDLVSGPADEIDILDQSLATLVLLDNTQNQDGQELVRYANMVRNVAKFCRRLRALPNLKELDLLWHQSCHLVPYDCGIEFSDGLLTMDNLEWMGLNWATIYGLKTRNAQEALERLSDKEKALFSERQIRGLCLPPYAYDIRHTDYYEDDWICGPDCSMCYGDYWEMERYSLHQKDPIRDQYDAYKSR
ncbi:hypothetical protein BGX29_005241, partial [Mortierella sp. GBA35]